MTVRGVDAHMRRSCALLEAISRGQRSAVVFWKGWEVGTWEQVVRDWQRTDGLIQMRFRTPLIPGPLHVSSVRRTPRGAELIVAARGLRPRPVISVVWNRAVSEPAGAGSDAVAGLCDWVRRSLPTCRMLALASHADRRNSLSSCFVRLRLRCPAAEVLVLAPRDEHGPDSSQKILTQALLWLLHWRRALSASRIPEIHLLVGPGLASVPMHRAALLDPRRVRVHVRERGVDRSGRWTATRPPPLRPPREGRDYCWPATGPLRWSPALEQVTALAPGVIRRHPRYGDYDSLRILGLEFGRACGAKRDRICYGVGPEQRELRADTFEDLRSLVDRILYFRRPDSPDPAHPFFRLQSERWLECLLLDDFPHLFPELLPEHVYPQVPLYLAALPGRLDILAMRHDRVLVVMELKSSESTDLPLQALDYWGRVIDHNRRGDFEKRGYFAGQRIRRDPPRIYLVAPVFSFHDSTEHLLAFLRPEIEVWKIAVNEDWRCGIRLLHHARCR